MANLLLYGKVDLCVNRAVNILRNPLKFFFSIRLEGIALFHVPESHSYLHTILLCGCCCEMDDRQDSVRQKCRLRSEDDPRLSISRYLVTVRRAIFTVSPVSISAIFWSESGFWEFSFSIISLILFFTLSEATKSPPLVERPLLKKYFNSSNPCGVCIYLLVVTRLIVDSCMPISSATSLNTNGRRYSMPRSKYSR